MKKCIPLIFCLFHCGFILSQTLNKDELVRIKNVTNTDDMNAIILPLQGNLVYNKATKVIYQFNGTEWVALGNAWSLNGNNQLLYDNYVGTSNNQDLKFRTNNIERMVIKANGNIGIGDDNPDHAFVVKGGSGGLSNDILYSGNVTSENVSYAISSVDFNTNTYAIMNALNSNIGMDCSANPVNIVKYSLTCSGTVGQWQSSSNAIKSFVFEARNTNGQWQTLDVNNNIVWNDTETKEYSISNTNSYQWYRIRPTEFYSPYNTAYVYEIEMFKSTESSFVVSNDGPVGIGTTTPSENLHVEGNILANGSITPDYVFEHYFEGKSTKANYQLQQLEEVEQFVKANKHLPGVLSAKEIQQQGGVIINQATEKNLEKIEELFLYAIELKTEIQHLKREIQKFKE